MHGDVLKYMAETYETNWMSTVGASINEVERTAAEKEEVDSDSQQWEDRFQAALNHYDVSETSRAELKALYAKFNAWNEENLGTVKISDELKELLDALAT